MHNSSLNTTQAACNLGFIFNAHLSLSQIKSYHSPNSAVIILTDFAASAIIFISKSWSYQTDANYYLAEYI